VIVVDASVAIKWFVSGEPLVEALGMTRVGNGHELLALAADFADRWKISGYDAIYLALVALTEGVWLTADARAERRVEIPGLVRLLGC